MTAAAIAAVSAAFAALDFSAENEQIAVIETQIAELESARSVADARRNEIGLILSDARQSVRLEADRGTAIADALLAGSSAGEAVAAVLVDQDAMREEREAIRLGANDLASRIDAQRKALAGIHAYCRVRAGEAAAPLVDALAQDARDAGERIIRASGALAAIQAATRAGLREMMQSREAVAAIAGNVEGHRTLLPVALSIEVPQEVLAAIGQLDGKGAALPLRAITSVSLR